MLQNQDIAPSLVGGGWVTWVHPGAHRDGPVFVPCFERVARDGVHAAHAAPCPPNALWARIGGWRIRIREAAEGVDDGRNVREVDHLVGDVGREVNSRLPGRAR